MLFNSYPFLLLFLPTVLAGFFLLSAWKIRAAAIWLTVASLAFYAWWDVRYLGLLVPSVVANFLVGRMLGALAVRRCDRARRWLLAGAVAANLAVLGYFKYVNFFLSTVDAMAAAHFGTLQVILPLGISFFTFTQIAFLVDASRGEVRHFDFAHYALFVTYFPHLIAGPILHHGEMIPQFRSPLTYRRLAENIAVGLSYFALGLAKKCVIADQFAPDVAAVFNAASGSAHSVGMLYAWQGALAYTLQLYFDFSGYCDMAVGLSRMFGIRLPFNFNSPYKATNIIDFWRRWHMTLSRFLRDYLYIPLGGSRRGRQRRYVNLMLTMLLGGLWHGANWTFVVWGGLHGLYLVVNHGWRAIRPARLLDRIPARLRQTAALAVTFAAVVAAWVVFRAPDIATAGRLLGSMTGAFGFTSNGVVTMPPSSLAEWTDVAGLPSGLSHLFEVARYAAVVAIAMTLPNTQQLIDREQFGGMDRSVLPQISLAWRSNFVWGATLGILGALAVLTFTRVSDFLYFQF
jgi:alginate O-acetyltransferase complex protein AlgI